MTAWVDTYPAYAAMAGLLGAPGLAAVLWLAGRSLRRRPVVAAVVAVVAAMFGPVVAVDAAKAQAAPQDQPVYSFVSAPDLENMDQGDLHQLDTWRPGFGNSTNAQYRENMRIIMDQMASEPGDDVLVAGDLVEGHWGADVEGTGFFGPTNTEAQRKDAIRTAGDFYYREWKERFVNRGLNPWPAIGDHEIGDNPWSGPGGYGAGNDFKREAFPVYKQVWAEHFPKPGADSRPVHTNFEDTAYSVYLHDEVLLITVDVFMRANGDVHARLTDGQLAWVDQVLDETTASTVIVQGHTPVLGPVNQEFSSGLMYEGGKQSPFWQTLVAHDDADTNVLYFAGEVHTVTALRAGGVEQISHGGLIQRGRQNYMTGQVFADGTLEFAIHRFSATGDWSDDAPKLWATSWKRPFADVTYQPGTTVTGTMTVGPTGTTAGGELAFQ